MPYRRVPWGYSGLEIKGGSIKISHCEFVNNGGAGAFIRESASGTFRYNLLEGNGLAGLEVTDQGDPLVEHNRLVNNEGSGIYFLSSGKGTYRDNVSSKGTRVSLAIEVKESPGAVFSGNTVDGTVKGVSSY